MKTMTAAEAKTHFGKFLDNAQREPVLVTKKSRPVAVMFSIEDLEDTIWAQRALDAHKEGTIGEEASRELMDDILNAGD